MIRLTREHNPRACDGCGKSRLVVLYALGSKTWRACTDCDRKMHEGRARLYGEQLDSLELP